MGAAKKAGRRLKHVGLESMLAERERLLATYDRAKRQTSDDRVKADHGVAGEAIFREWLKTFLPRRFDVTKGYVITPNPQFKGDLEEWDLIVYDALDAPVLYVRDSADVNEVGKKRGIPVEHVRAVIEVKARLNKKSAELMRKKLERLRHFVGANQADEYPYFLSMPFLSAGIFFETDVTSLKKYRSALDEIAPLCAHNIAFLGALVLRSQKDAGLSARLEAIAGLVEPLPDVYELSSQFRLADGRTAQFGSIVGYGVNVFYPFIFDLLRGMRGPLDARMSSFYGLDFANTQCKRLFS